MSKDNSSSPISARYPNMGNLTVALLEHIVEPVLGKDFIKELKLPYTNNQLRNKFRDALFATEKEFIQQNKESKISEGLVQLHIADLNSIQEAFWRFIENPTTLEFPRTLYEQICSDYPNVPDNERKSAINKYLKILWSNLIGIDEEVRKKVCASVLLSLQEHIESIDLKLNKLEKLDSIDEKFQKLLDLLTTYFDVPKIKDVAPSSQVQNQNKRIAQSQPLKIMNANLREEMSSLTTSDLEQLYQILSGWIVSVVTKHEKIDVFDRPYGHMCLDIIDGLLPSTYISTGVVPSESLNKEWKKIVDHIFKSDLVESLPFENEKNCVRLKSLSEQFPIHTKVEEPFGFYLVDKSNYHQGYKSMETGWMEEDYDLVWFDSDEEQPRISKNRFFLVFVSNQNINDWIDLTKQRKDKLVKNWKSRTKTFLDSIKGHERIYTDKLYYRSQEICFTSLLGSENFHRFSIDIDHARFSNFALSIAQDFLSLASHVIIAESQIKAKNEALKKALKKK